MQVVGKNRNMGASLTTSTLRNIADDRLRQAAGRFKVFRAKLKQLRNVLREHHSDLVRAETSRNKVVQALIDVSEDSPIFNLVGGLPDDLDHSISFAAVHTDFGREMSIRLQKYQDEMIRYVANWESTVTTRIATELRHVDKLYKDFVRYHNKVEALKASAEKKKNVKDADLDKISRNESKLRTARKEYRRNLVNITLLTEEVTDRGWKDLLPLMAKMIDCDVEACNKTAEVMNELVEVQREMEDKGDIRNGRLHVLLEEEAMEFVKPEYMQDIESIQASVTTYVYTFGPDGLRSSEPDKTPPSSENDSVYLEDQKDGELASPSKAQFNPNDAAPQDSSPYDEKSKPVNRTRAFSTPDMAEEVEAIRTPSTPNYPSSIYLKFDGEDETTLTDYVGVASC
jgi:hypothetical protein